MDTMKCIFFCLLFAFTAGASAETPTILVMGDSLCAAYRIRATESWVTLLQERLKQRGYDYGVVKACVSGATTADGLARLPKLLEEHKPVIVMLELGGNDGPPDALSEPVKDNLDRILTLVHGSGAKILMLGVELPPDYAPGDAQRFRSMYASLAKRYQAQLVPFLLEGVADHPEMMQGDGIHPKANAEPRVLDNVWPKLAPMLMKPSTK